MLSQSVTNPLVQALKEHSVSAVVVDFDHYRIKGGMAVETDYIISVQPSDKAAKKGDAPFEYYRISKTYSAFRSLGHQLQKVAKAVTKKKDKWESLNASQKNVVALSESVNHLVDSQKTEYLGKVNFTYVKSMAKQRGQVINDILTLLIDKFPEKIKGEDINVGYMAGAIETFFLTDFCEEDEDEEEEEPAEKPDSKKKGLKRALTPNKLKRNKSKTGDAAPSLTTEETPKEMETPKPKKTVTIEEPTTSKEGGLASPSVMPITRKKRRSVAIRELDENSLQKDGSKANFVMGDTTTSTATGGEKSAEKGIGDMLDNNPYAFYAVSALGVYALRFLADSTITMDTDYALLVVFGFFCLGLHLPSKKQAEVVKPQPAVSSVQSPRVSKPAQRNASMLLRKSMSRRSMMMSPKASMQGGGGKQQSLLEVLEEVEAEVEEGEEDPLIISPLPVYPKGAKLGEIHNCWSEPTCTDFKVRGPKYLSDKKKVASGPFIFPVRGVDLFLTDLCPENVGTNSGIMGGNLRDVPTFLINFRLPWGVLLFYFEIPERFLPFLYKCYDPAFDDSTLPNVDKMSNSDRTVARYLMGDQDYKNDHLKIVPIVQKGPWIVKSVVGGKPAIVGNKLPITYVYQPAEGDKALYLEADLDIVGSAAARGILSVASNAAAELTIDLGFVIEARETDELPEEMLVGARLHGIDPMTAPALPPSKDMFLFQTETMSTDEGSDED